MYGVADKIYVLRRSTYLTACAFAGAAVVIGIRTALRSPTDHSQVSRLVFAGIGAFQIAAGAWFYLRIARSRVEANRLGVRAVNPLQRVNRPWSEITGFTISPYQPGTVAVTVETTDQKKVGLFALQAARPAQMQRIEKAKQELDELLREHLAATVGAST